MLMNEWHEGPLQNVDNWEAHNSPPNRTAKTFILSFKRKAQKWIEGKVFNNEQEKIVAIIEHFS